MEWREMLNKLMVNSPFVVTLFLICHHQAHQHPHLQQVTITREREINSYQKDCNLLVCL